MSWLYDSETSLNNNIYVDLADDLQNIVRKSRVKENIKDMFCLLSQSYGCDVPILSDKITTYQSKKHNYDITL